MSPVEPYPHLIETLSQARKANCFPPPTRKTATAFGEAVLGLLFPHFAKIVDCDVDHIREELETVLDLLCEFMTLIVERYPSPAAAAREKFVNSLQGIHDQLILDAQAILDGDPAAKDLDEVVLTYPGFFAIAVYRVAHSLLTLGYPLLPRLLSEWAHSRTGIDIHPGASIGSRFFIDHGTGIVIGETTVIGECVKLYQGVTLGALVVEKQLAQVKRHPTIGNGVIIYANATILGGATVVGDDSVVGGNAWITSSVPARSTVNRQSRVMPTAYGTRLGEFSI